MGPTLALLPGTVLGVVLLARLARRIDKGHARPVVLWLSALSAVAVLVRELAVDVGCPGSTAQLQPVWPTVEARWPTRCHGREVLLDVLRSEGVRHVFGNPGSTELPLVDALAGVDDIAYVLALQEATVVGHGRRVRPGDGTTRLREPAHLRRPRQRHRQPHQRHAPTAPRSSSPPGSRTSVTWRPTRCCRDRWSTWPSATVKWAHEVR